MKGHCLGADHLADNIFCAECAANSTKRAIRYARHGRQHQTVLQCDISKADRHVPYSPVINCLQSMPSGNRPLDRSGLPPDMSLAKWCDRSRLFDTAILYQTIAGNASCLPWSTRLSCAQTPNNTGCFIRKHTSGFNVLQNYHENITHSQNNGIAKNSTFL